MTRYLTVAALTVGLAGATQATATQITLSMQTDSVITKLRADPNGTQYYGWEFGRRTSQTLDVTITGDNGLPLDGCLNNGVKIELVDATGAVLDTTDCPTAGKRLLFSQVKLPTTLSARIATATTAGFGSSLVPVGAAVSNPVVVLLAPQIVNTSPSFSRAARYPLRGVVRMQKPRVNGKVLLQQKKGAKWITLGVKTTAANGAFSFSVPQGRRGTTRTYRFRYRVKPNIGWIDGVDQFSIRTS